MGAVRIIARASRMCELRGPVSRDDLVAAVSAILACDGERDGYRGPAATLLHAEEREPHRFGPREPRAESRAAIAHLAGRAGIAGTEGDAYKAVGGGPSSIAVRIEWPQSATARAVAASLLPAMRERAAAILSASGYDGPDPFAA